MKAHVILQVKNTKLGEGPVWDDRTQELWWVDIHSSLLHCFHPESGNNRSYDMGQQIGAVIPCEQEGLMVALQHGFAFFNPETGVLDKIVDPESHLPDHRFNDGKCDPAGRFWAGTMTTTFPRTATGGFYCLDTNLKVSKKLSDIIISNGLAWNKAADKMYYIDTAKQKVESFFYNIKTSEIIKEKDVLVFDNIYPDGMSVDENDNLWIAFYGSHKVLCFNPTTGEQVAEIEVPTPRVTSCAFGGKNLDTLYITSAAEKGDPLGGALFSVKPGVKGCKAHFFKN